MMKKILICASIIILSILLYWLLIWNRGIIQIANENIQVIRIYYGADANPKVISNVDVINAIINNFENVKYEDNELEPNYEKLSGGSTYSLEFYDVYDVLVERVNIYGDGTIDTLDRFYTINMSEYYRISSLLDEY